VRPEPLEERRKRPARLLSRSNKALRDGIQLSEAITGDGVAIFRHAIKLEGIASKRIGSRYVSSRTRAWLKTKNRNLREREETTSNLACGTSQPRSGNPATSNLLPSMLQALAQESPPS
jgi:ATP-dependent DNA ligase